MSFLKKPTTLPTKVSCVKMKPIHALFKAPPAAPSYWSKALLTRLWLPVFVALLLVYVTALLLHINRTDYVNIQTEAFLFINQVLKTDSNFWLNVTQLGDAMILFPLLSILIPRYPQLWAALFGAVPLSAVLSYGGKSFFSTPRPAAVLDQQSFTILGDTLTAHNSLPSGHTITIFAAVTVVLAVLLSQPDKKYHYFWLVMGVFVAFFIGISRVAVGAHWPLDVALGAALGYLGGLSGVVLTQRYSAWWQWLELPKYRFISSIILLIFVVAVVYHFSDPDYAGLMILWPSVILGGFMSLFLLLRNKQTKRSS